MQNTTGVQSIYDIPTTCIEEQLKAILDDISLDAIKIGMLHREDIIESVATLLTTYSLTNIVLDPVMVAKSGDRWLKPSAIEALKKQLFPLTTVLTPNLLESSELLNQEIQNKSQMEHAALSLLQLGPKAVIVKGGHLQGSCDDCICIRDPHPTLHWLSSPRIQTRHTHGTGCTLSAAIASYLAKGLSILDAITQAKHYLTQAISAGAHLKIGPGNGPVHHFHHLWNSAL